MTWATRSDHRVKSSGHGSHVGAGVFRHAWYVQRLFRESACDPANLIQQRTPEARRWQLTRSASTA